MTFPPLGNSNHVVVSLSIDFLSNSKGDSPFYWIAYDCSCVDWDGLHDHFRDVPGYLLTYASTAASEFYELIQVRFDVYIPHPK